MLCALTVTASLDATSKLHEQVRKLATMGGVLGREKEKRGGGVLNLQEVTGMTPTSVAEVVKPTWGTTKEVE